MTVICWDEKKNRTNHRKHGIWFDEAQTIWADQRAIEFFDPEHSEVEDRFIRIGSSTAQKILLVVFCERASGGREVIRILSARTVTKSERRQHEEGI
ncbi:MAG: BrnT family toxin [Deltaproteobacteria bacterium]|nr:BrnT family toxin [Deltaproteobacteria bacterium]